MIKAPGQFGWSWAFCGWWLEAPSFFFRIFGYGLHLKVSRELTFSERMGLKHYVRIGDIVIRTLTPERR